MTTPSVGGSVVPSTCSNTGHYRFHRQEKRISGSGAQFGVGYQRATWEFAALGSTDWQWWRTQYNRGSAMPFELWEDDTRKVQISFTSGRLLEPDYERISGGKYVGVKIEIIALTPIQV